MSYLTQSLHRLVQRASGELASIDPHYRRTWTDVARDVAQFAGALRASGIRDDDRVALLARNGGHHLDYILGTAWAGAIITPVNTRATAAEIAMTLSDCGAEVLLVDDSFVSMIDAIRAGAPCLRLVIQMGGGAREAAADIDYAAWLATARPVDDVRRGGDALAAILYTGGTTGRPKGVMLSHANLLASAGGYVACPGARPGARYLHVAPLFHIGAQSALYASLLTGTTQVFLPLFTPVGALAAIENENITDVFLVPTMLAAMVLEPDFGRAARLERIVYGASPIDEALLESVMTALPDVGFVQAYGMTEVSPIATMLGPDDHRGDARALGRTRSAGRATIAAEIRIVDETNRDLPCGSIGEIVVRGGGVMKGYWSMPEASAAAVRDGWMRTGDLGRIDAAGYVTVVDRLKDMIISGGENIYSSEVENALTAHPAVHQAGVIGVPDPRWGEAVHAVVVLKPEALCSVDALRTHCRSLIAGYKVPKSMIFVPALPLSPTGKVLKTELRALYGQDSQIRTEGMQ